MKTNSKTIMRCLLALLCLVRIIMPSVIYAEGPKDVDAPVSVTEYSGKEVKETYGDVTVVNDPNNENVNYGWAVHGDSAGDNSKVDLTTGDVSLSNDSKEGKLYYGVDADATGGSSTYITTESVTVSNINKETAEIVGVNADANFGGSTVTVETGNILVSGEAGTQTGVAVYSMSFGRELLDEEDLDLDELKGNASVASVTTGTVTVNGGTGVEVDSILKAVSNVTTGTINAEDGLDISAEYGGESNAVVNGNIIAKDNGIILSSDANSKVDVFVDGTVSATTPLVISETTTADNASVTLWKMENTVTEEAQGLRGSSTVSDTDPKVADIVNYIIRIEQNSQLLNPVKADGSALDTSHDLNVAKENTEIVLNVAEGWSIINAYNNGQQLEKDEFGRFILVVPYGGGIEFSAEFEQNIPVDGGADDAPSGGSSSSETSTSVVVRFVPPTTGVDDRHINIAVMCMHLLDLLIIALFCTSFITKANYNQFHNTLPDYLK